jgi:hypothetical protein
VLGLPVFWERTVLRMKRYVFIPPQSLNLHPRPESPVPDFMDMDEDYFGQSINMEEALKDMLGISENTSREQMQETFRLDLHNDQRQYFALRDYKNKISKAS